MTDADLMAEPKWVVRRQQLLAEEKAVDQSATEVAACPVEFEARSEGIEPQNSAINELADGERSWEERIVQLGSFGTASQSAVTRCEEIMLTVERPEEIEFTDTPEGHADLVLCSVNWAEMFIADGDADKAASSAFYAGICWALLNLEPDSVRGRKLLESARQGHQAVHGDETSKMALWDAMYRDYAAEIAKGTKKTAAAALVAEKYGVCDRTVRNAQKYISKRKSLESPATFQNDMRHGEPRQIAEE
ncbi:hypothetical protein [Hyphomicrobium sulfonivorans]|uniref:hypothetical protein n=1 Tax=Hyphomicrobium sulfonivorans TaxID=121290 RepID=UPI0015714406|nr:hypothetical protein [Hyphomicrobium sulfonivorans]MBI1650112.1 hypothetical protein [Hyphomicrobium sulfonivorans]NSL73028.1 hypothetical protein [Hyphomicrobium sulfonivorans]